MNMRQLKRSIYARIFHNKAFGIGWYSDSYYFGGNALEITECDVGLQVEAAKVEFVCVKVKDGSVVDTFDTREAALELVLKHAKQKKAKLQVMNSLTQELVVFAEEEMA